MPPSRPSAIVPRMRKTAGALACGLAVLAGCGGGGGGGGGGSTSSGPPPVVFTGPCATKDEGGEAWPAWAPGETYAAHVSAARAEYVKSEFDWRVFYQAKYQANGDFLNL